MTDFARWLDTDFADLNTELEEAYFAARSIIQPRVDLLHLIAG